MARLFALFAVVVLVGPVSAEIMFVRVPYLATIDELTVIDLMAGKHKDNEDRVRVRDGKIEMKFGAGRPGENKFKWEVLSEEGGLGTTLITSHLFGNDKVPVNSDVSDGIYLMATDVYEKWYKDRLIQKHKGRLEYIMTAEAKKRLDDELKITGELKLTTNPLDFDAYVWDETDKCWRWPVTLGRLSAKHVAAVKLKEPLAQLQRGVIEELLVTMEKKLREARIAEYERNKTGKGER